MVRRYRRALRLRPVNSVKNIVDSVNIGVAAGTTTTVVIANAVNDYAGATADVPIGSKVSSVYLFFQIQPQAAQGQVDAYIAKFPSGISPLPAPGATGGSPLRKFVLHEEKGIPGTFNNGSPPLTFRGVVKIPRGRQRFGEDDDLVIKVSCSTAYDFCMKAIYKFYQ